ncbi:uncharacterized protein LOC131932596 [Physella acuta]|uniref:uncharacterized protein LOC131932596 n=1 Tax=Physella acuta TaxID=109671 RepID=UPI0027DD5EF3|nr:uncharacterized protein LOC131932596 [Physella acuta]
MAALSLSLLLTLSTCSLVLAATDTSKFKITSTFVERLFKMISEDQVQKEVPYIPFRQWHRAKGVYTSGVKINFNGPQYMTEARRLMNVIDNNMFVTAWVTTSLLEAFKYGDAPKLSDTQLSLALNVFQNFHDKNKPYNTSTMSFWPQVYNQTLQVWQCTPQNLLGVFQMIGDLPLNTLEEILKIFGLNNLAKDIELILNQKDIFVRAFHIPPDFDDTFVNLGLGSLLYQMRDQFQTGWQLWSSQNTNITSAIDALKKYAYRPFSSDPNQNTIDPRTYLYIRKFLDQARSEGKEVALVPTWIQSIEEVRTMFYLGVNMPFQLNNVDVTVSANTIYGMTSSILSGLVSPDVLRDPELEQIYLNTSSLITFEVRNNLTDRPDLALTYYPSQIEFYWFVARTLTELETAKRKGPLPVPAMDAVYKMFKTAAEGEMTKQILSKARVEPTEKVYLDDFLGDGDYNHRNESIIHAEDRIFTTAMAANALMYTWSVYDEKTKTSHWKDDIPPQVLTTITGCINWLMEHTTDGKYEPWNVFFSGSAKGYSSLPFWYPGNRFEYLNGTAIDDWSNIPNTTFLYGVQGYIPTDRYDAMLNQTHFGQPTPITFNGFNDPTTFFPFWSSAPYTYSTTLLAVSRFSNIVG